MNKTIVVTGATKGIGKAIAEKFLSAHYDVVICARSQTDLETLQQAWTQQYPQQNIYIFAADFSKEQEVKDFATYILTQLTTIDVLVNNAGIFLPGNMLEEEDHQLKAMMDVNLMSAYYLTKALFPRLKAQQSGHIINICSVASLHSYGGGTSYSVSKYALLGFSDNIRTTCRPHGIKVTAICPGPTMSHSWEGSGIDETKLMKASDVADIIWQTAQLSIQACVERVVLNPMEVL
ncbi:short-chain dehydrogenase [Taibaiella sp. KBW10]|uniref:SDR family oxidoreductase n=1 Tax=Taibaiella sp. KBW10 TaxID=2153357 RepID=UPI000F5A1DF8|nr:SDR family oxidoreductase [Taibaiella sp. KBW10]RQO32007.1 short-chain dehydrogenase [Taibaiella sp. KBW10]